jgi:hypothetical protein
MKPPFYVTQKDGGWYYRAITGETGGPFLNPDEAYHAGKKDLKK